MRIQSITSGNVGSVGTSGWKPYVNIGAPEGPERDEIVERAQRAAEAVDPDITTTSEAVGVSVNIWIVNNATDVSPLGPIGVQRTVRAQSAAYRVFQAAMMLQGKVQA